MKKATEIFGKWAEEGKDIGMETGHANSVNEMLDYALQERSNLEKKFSKFVDNKFGISVQSGTAALHLALKAVGTKPKHKIIIRLGTGSSYFTEIAKIRALRILVDSITNHHNMEADLVVEVLTKTSIDSPTHKELNLLRATTSFSSHAITSLSSLVIVLKCLTASTTFPVPASPLVLIIDAPSAILLVASPRPVAPHTKGALKFCLLI